MPFDGVEVSQLWAEAKQLLSAASAADHRKLESGNDFWVVPFDLACIHAIEGDEDAAFQWLDRPYEAGWRGWPQASWSPLLDPLRGDPRFTRLMARIDADVAAMPKTCRPLNRHALARDKSPRGERRGASGKAAQLASFKLDHLLIRLRTRDSSKKRSIDVTSVLAPTER